MEGEKDKKEIGGVSNRERESDREREKERDMVDQKTICYYWETPGKPLYDATDVCVRRWVNQSLTVSACRCVGVLCANNHMFVTVSL